MAQVTPLPSIGEVFAGQDVSGRTLRVSAHPDADRTVLSIWQDGRCLATVRLFPADVPEVIRALAAGLVPTTTAGGHRAEVRQLHPGPATVPAWRRSLTVTGDRTRRLTRTIKAAVRDF